jgi:DNA-binding MarR family transcriptional regulator
MHFKTNNIMALAVSATDAVAAGYARLGLAEREVAALVLVGSHPAAQVDWLHGRLGLTQSGTVRLVDRLAAAGLIQRGRPGPGRRVPLSLTPAGRDQLARAMTARDDALFGTLEPLSAREREIFAALTAKALAGQPRDRSVADATCRLCDWPACAAACPVDSSVASPAGP